MRTFRSHGAPELLAALPPLPAHGHGDGYDWLWELRGGWTPEHVWGAVGLSLGQWPLIVVTFCGPVQVGDTARCAYGVATWIEGDVTVQAFDHALDMVTALDLAAHHQWRRAADITGVPIKGVPEIGPLERRFHGPHWDDARREWRALLGITVSDDEYTLQVDYGFGDGWENLTSENSRDAIEDHLAIHRESNSGTYRLLLNGAPIEEGR